MRFQLLQQVLKGATPWTCDRVVVPLDGSDLASLALPVAEGLAKAFAAELQCITVDPDQEASMVLYGPPGSVGPGEPQPREIEVISADDVAGAIVERARVEGSLLCMSSHGRGVVAEAVLGSVAADVVRRLSAPAVLVGPNFEPESWRGVRRIVASVDGSPLSEEILPVVTSWARSLDVRLDLVQVLSPDVPAWEAATPGDILESNYLHRVANTLDEAGLDPQWDVLHGDDVADAISDYADQVPGTVVALTTHGRTALSRVAMGSVAARLTKTCRSPLLVVRPAELPES